VWQAVLGAGFLEFLAGDHDGHRGFGDEVVGEGAEENTFEGASPTRSKDNEGWVEHVDSFGDHMLWALAVDDFHANANL